MEDIFEIMTEQELDDVIAAQEEEPHQERTRAYRRRQRELHIERKEKILKKWRRDNMPASVDATDLFHFSGKELNRDFGECIPYWGVESRGHLAKGKIHCSCPMCSFQGKTMQDVRSIGKMLADAMDSAMVDSSDLNKMRAAAAF